MDVPARKQVATEEAVSPEREAAAKPVAAWVQQFARTLKNCRLYDASNPAVARLKQDLAAALQRLLDAQGPITLQFSSTDVLFDDISLYPARSREDNLALAFYRDGTRGLAFRPGITPQEVSSLIDAVLAVTGQTQGEDDLVTLLWEAQLSHIDIDFVPAEADVGSGAPTTEGAAVPWPSGVEAEETSATPGTEQKPEDAAAAGHGRSDDWDVGEQTSEIEASLAEIEAMAAAELERFKTEFEEERGASTVGTAIAVARAYVSAASTEDDLAEMARFLPRVLRQAFAQGHWRDASEAWSLLGRCGTSEWSVETFGQELLQPISISAMKERLETQESAEMTEFIAFARRLGEPAVDLFNMLLAELENPKHQRALAEALVEDCRAHPERLAPWLGDHRPHVVRNAVQLLGLIGGDGIVGLLEGLVSHPDPRVRQEVLTALRRADPQAAQRLLLGMLEGAETRQLCAVLSQLGQRRSPEVAKVVLGYLLQPEFEQRPPEERRAIYSALGNSGGDEVLPELEAELHRGNWFSRVQETHRQSIARCVARIGTPLARAVLERGVQSKRAPVRKACEDVLARFGTND